MNNLTLDISLEACNMGNQQGEIAEFVENHPLWATYVDKVNQAGIPSHPADETQPSDEWRDKQSFHPDDLIGEACKVLNWQCVPDTGGLVMNFY